MDYIRGPNALSFPFKMSEGISFVPVTPLLEILPLHLILGDVLLPCNFRTQDTS